MEIQLNASVSLEAGKIHRNAVKEFIDALPENATLTFRSYSGDQREGTNGGITIDATWKENR